MSLLDTASLIVTPNGYKEGKLYSVIPSDGSGDLSVTRATTATRVNSQGLVELVPYNLLSWSEDLTNAAWTSINTTEVIGATAPDGTATAWTLSKSAANGRLYQVPASTDGSMVASVYAKAGTLNQVAIEMNTSYRVLDLSTGTLVSGGSGSYNIEDVGNGWYRFSVVDSSYSGVAIWANPASSTSGNILIWHPQVEAGTTATTYQKTETRLNIPRLDYSNGTCPSILVEPQRTNLVTWSSSFDNAAWVKSAHNGIVANAIISPDGTQNADKIESISNSGGVRYTNQAISTTVGTYSIYMKAGELTQCLMYGAGDGIYWNLTDGSFIGYYAGGSNITSYSSEDVGNGWYRYTMTNTNGFSYAEIYMSVNQTLGTAIPSGQGFYLWGAQVEAGSYATSYIPTTSASVTRNADVISKTGISSLIGQTEGTIFIDAYRTQKSVNYQALIGLGNGTSSSQMMEFFYRSSNELTIGVYNSGQQFVNNTVIANGRHKIALAYKENDFALYIDGVLIATDNSGTVPTMNQLNIGGFNYTSGDEYADGINAVALWKQRLSNTQLAQLTTI